MKTKLSTVVLLITIAVMLVSCGSQKQVASQNQQISYEKDGAKQVVEDLKKQGYTPYGSYSMFTLYELVNKIREKIKADMERYIPIEGVGEGVDLSSAKLFALSNASIQYATQAGSKVSGKLRTLFSNLTEDSRTKIVGVYTQEVSEFVMPIFTENYVVGKPEGARIRILANYMIDEVKAKEARERAMNSAVSKVAKEVAISKAFMDSVEEMVNEQPVE